MGILNPNWYVTWMMWLELKINALNASWIETKKPELNHIKNGESNRIGKTELNPVEKLESNWIGTGNQHENDNSDDEARGGQ